MAALGHHTTQISWNQFFFEKYFFQGPGAFFAAAIPLIWALFFSKKNFLYSLFQV